MLKLWVTYLSTYLAISDYDLAMKMSVGSAERNLRFRHFLALKNAPDRNDLVQEKYLEMVKTISDALVDAGIERSPLPRHPKVSLGMTRSGARGVLRTVLELAYAQGMSDGLTDGWGLHKFGLKVESDPRCKYIIRYVKTHPKKDCTDEKVCRHLDAQIDRLADLDERKKPTPLKSWHQVSWEQALKDKTETGEKNRVCDSVMSYIHRYRRMARGEDYGLLEAWKELTVDGKGRRK
jgi:hypothetical protein